MSDFELSSEEIRATFGGVRRFDLISQEVEDDESARLFFEAYEQLGWVRYSLCSTSPVIIAKVIKPETRKIRPKVTI